MYNLVGYFIGGCLLYHFLHSLYILHVFLNFGVENVGSLCFINDETELILGHL